MYPQLDLVIDSSVHASAGAFVVCWTPGLVTLLLDGLLGKDSHANMYEKFCLVMAECNSLVNPIIYTLRDEELRRTFRWILCGLCRRNGQRDVSPIEFAPNTPQVHVQDSWVPLTTFDHWRISCYVPVCRKLSTLSRSQKSTQLNPTTKAAGAGRAAGLMQEHLGTHCRKILFEGVFLLYLSQTTSFVSNWIKKNVYASIERLIRLLLMFISQDGCFQSPWR